MQSLLARRAAFLECMDTDLSLPLLPLPSFVVHSCEISAGDMFLGVAEFANRGGPVPSTREDVFERLVAREKIVPRILTPRLFQRHFLWIHPVRTVSVTQSLRWTSSDRLRNPPASGVMESSSSFWVHRLRLLIRTVVLDEVHAAITADIPVPVWSAGAVLSIRVDVENPRLTTRLSRPSLRRLVVSVFARGFCGFCRPAAYILNSRVVWFMPCFPSFTHSTR